MRWRKTMMVVLLTVGLAGCAGFRRAKTDPGALMEADRAFAQATAQRRLEGFTSFLAEDVTSIRPNSPIIKGRDGLAARWKQLLNDPALSITWEPVEAMISEGGDLGYTVGGYVVSRSSDSGRRQAASGKYVTVWKKQAGGAWKVVFDSGVQDAPPK
ncbi:MAG TPA: DUF4440 domain-containing protein [Bryobacteraceae bacterium]|nr:DUF4440 domain-containing protein [Bryobacteraceae bacterium]